MKSTTQQFMQCDPETGICEVPGINKNKAHEGHKKPVRLLYFTDPICSSCWGIEPQLRKLKLEYGNYFDIEFRMGGLLKSWNEYGGSDVSNPTEVAKHWNEAGEYYNMPIDGDVWIEDALDSSYPPSIAFKAAQVQDAKKAEIFLRRIKEMVFLEKKNITKWEHLAQAAIESGLEIDQFKTDFDNKAPDLFEEDLDLRRQMGVRGFPTIFFIDEDGNQFKVYGSKPYEQYEQALLKLLPGAIKKELPSSHENVLSLYDSITTKEFAVLNDKTIEEAEVVLESLLNQKQLKKMVSKTGPLWIVKKT